MKIQQINFKCLQRGVLLLAVAGISFGCTQETTSEAAGSLNKLEALLQPAPPAGDSKFEIKVNEQAFYLGVNGKTIQKITNKGQGVSLESGGKPGSLSLVEAPKGMKTLKFMATRVRDVSAGKIGQVAINGTISSTGKITMLVSGINQQTAMKSDTDLCSYLDLGTEEGRVLVGTGIQPIDVEFSDVEVRYTRRGEGSDPKTYKYETIGNPFYILSCPELGDSRSRIVAGGLGIVIVLDGIHEPGRKFAREGLTDEQRKFLQNSYNMLFAETTKICDSVKGKSWTKNPVACVPLSTKGIQIVCDRYILIPTSTGTVKIDTYECGVQVKIENGKIKFYSGCMDAATVICK